MLGGLLFVLAGCNVVQTNPHDDTAITNPIPITAPAINSNDKQNYLDAINAARRSAQNCGSKGNFPAVANVTWNDALYKAAYEHNKDMNASNVVNRDHTGSNTASDYTAQVQHLDHGSTTRDRIANNGYGAYLSTGEIQVVGAVDNVLMDTVDKVLQIWLSNDAKCANLMDPDFKEMGMAHLDDNASKYKHYWTVDFGSR